MTTRIFTTVITLLCRVISSVLDLGVAETQLVAQPTDRRSQKLRTKMARKRDFVPATRPNIVFVIRDLAGTKALERTFGPVSTPF